MYELHELKDTNNPYDLGSSFNESLTLSAKLRALVNHCNVTGRSIEAMTTISSGSILVITEKR